MLFKFFKYDLLNIIWLNWCGGGVEYAGHVPLLLFRKHCVNVEEEAFIAIFAPIFRWTRLSIFESNNETRAKKADQFHFQSVSLV